MTKRAITWKEGKILSVETRKGVFVLAQMLKRPFLRFYKVFKEDENWGKVDVELFETLFVNGVIAKTFLKLSNVNEVKGAIPDLKRKDTDIWIDQKKGSRKVRVYKGTNKEKEFMILGSEPGGDLIKKDLWWTPTPNQPTRPHPSGVIDDMILENIPLNSLETIDNYELTNLAVYPALNERLYLCYKLDRNVDPYKDLVFNKEISEDYQVAMEIMAVGNNEEEKERLLDTYFR